MQLSIEQIMRARLAIAGLRRVKANSSVALWLAQQIQALEAAVAEIEPRSNAIIVTYGRFEPRMNKYIIGPGDLNWERAEAELMALSRQTMDVPIEPRPPTFLEGVDVEAQVFLELSFLFES